MSTSKNISAEVLAEALRDSAKDLADSILDGLRSQNLADAVGQPATVVDVLHGVASNIARLADAITPGMAGWGEDACGGRVSSLTEALMGVTAAGKEISRSIDVSGDPDLARVIAGSIDKVADGLNNVAAAIREHSTHA